MTLLKLLDIILLALALPIFLVGKLPLLGWVTGAVVWLLWRGIGAYSEHRAAEQEDPRRMVGITAGSMIGRGWLLGLILIAAGLAAGDDVGLSAAVLAIVLFTASFTVKLILRPFDEGPTVKGGTSS
jgi:hypothetical protein